ncbi:MAG: hypothetical protein EA352_00230 [Gemmatimonadales bacterium]|nr:MAG: hypothetical protein EA352_00230 [Gemmatimonadales bacterium]
MGRTASVVLVLLSAILLPLGLSAQQGEETGTREGSDHGFELRQNYPNPFNPETWIPFELHDELFEDGQIPRVTIRIYNALIQPVATATALNHPAGEGTPILDLEYMTPGGHEAHWDGRDRSGAPVASGVYLLEMSVNGRSRMIRMYMSRGDEAVEEVTVQSTM